MNAALVHSHNFSFIALHELLSLMINMLIDEGNSTARWHKFYRFTEWWTWQHSGQLFTWPLNTSSCWQVGVVLLISILQLCLAAAFLCNCWLDIEKGIW